jgi:hypothetical protein
VQNNWFIICCKEIQVVRRFTFYIHSVFIYIWHCQILYSYFQLSWLRAVLASLILWGSTQYNSICSVFIHSSGVHVGRYYTYTSPLSNQWYVLFWGILWIFQYLCACIRKNMSKSPIHPWKLIPSNLYRWLKKLLIHIVKAGCKS